MRSDQPRKQHGFRAKTFLELSTLLCIFPYPSQAGIQQIAMMMSNRITTGSVQSPYTICASRSTAQHVTAASGPHLHNRCKQRLFSAYTSYNGSRKVQQLVCRSSSTQTQAPTELVDDLLQRIKGSGMTLYNLCTTCVCSCVCKSISVSIAYHACADSGVGLQADEEAGVNGIISQLEEVGKQQVLQFNFNHDLDSNSVLQPVLLTFAGCSFRNPSHLRIH